MEDDKMKIAHEVSKEKFLNRPNLSQAKKNELRALMIEEIEPVSSDEETEKV